jgi:DnaA initiator-associating protein
LDEHPQMSEIDRIRQIFALSIETAQTTATLLADPIERAAKLIVEALLAGNKLLCCGNGGSAADAQHFST